LSKPNIKYSEFSIDLKAIAEFSFVLRLIYNKCKIWTKLTTHFSAK